MKDKLKGAAIAIGAVAALALGGTAIAAATAGRDDDATDQPIAGRALKHATTVALNHTGGGTVTGTEVDDEQGAYEVEVTRADGSHVDVHLDTGFNVIDHAEDRDQGETE